MGTPVTETARTALFDDARSHNAFEPRVASLRCIGAGRRVTRDAMTNVTRDRSAGGLAGAIFATFVEA